jgi:hypothetical protein
MKNETLNELQQGMAVILAAIGFEAMAAGVQTETDPERLQRYGCVIFKNTKGEQREKISGLLRQLGL